MPSRPDRPPTADALQHVVHTHLTVIRGHAQLAARQARNLSEPERSQLLARLQAIDGAVEQLVRRLAPWPEHEWLD